MRRFELALGLLVAVVGLVAPPGLAQVCELVELDTVEAAGSLSQPAILGSTAYVAAGSGGVARINVSNPGELVLRSSTPTQGQAMDLVLDFFSNQLAVADGSAGVGLYSIGGETGLTHMATESVGETIISITGNSGQYLAGSQEGTLYAVTAGSSDIAIQGSLTTGGQVYGIAQNLQEAYVAMGTAGLGLVDVSDRSTPRLIQTLDLSGTVRSVVHEGRTVFCGVDGVGLVTVAVQEESLVPLGSISLPGTPSRAVSWGGRVYLVGPETGVVEIDATLGSDMLLLAHLALDGAQGLALAGNTIYVARGVSGMSTVDSTDCAQSFVSPTTSFLPAAARTEGAEGTFWLTDVALANLSGDLATFNMAYLQKDQENGSPLNASLVLQPGQQVMANDVLSSMFELEAGNGALRITASHPDVKVTSRTYNSGGVAGTFGQFIPALVRTDALVPGVLGALLQLQENEAFRTNLGLLNATAGTVQVDIHLYLGSGELVGIRTETLLPYEMVQVGRIYTTFGHSDVDSGFALVDVVSEGGEVLAYASVVDNISGDPIFIPASRLTHGTPVSN